MGQVPGATLTLVKQVVNTNGGTATAANWTLQAFGPVNLAGPGGSPQVTNQSVPIGTYDLRESGTAAGPGYVPSVWSCTGAFASTTNSVTLRVDNQAVCTITNSDTNVTTTIATTTTQIEATTTTSATNSTTTTTSISTTSSSTVPPSSSVPSTSSPGPPTGTLPAVVSPTTVSGLPPVR